VFVNSTSHHGWDRAPTDGTGPGLEWVADEVTSLIAQGVEEQVTAGEWMGVGRPKKGEVRITRREYSALERIDLLLDAVVRVVTDGAAVEASIAKSFAEPADSRTANTVTARFMPEAGSDGAEYDYESPATEGLADRAEAIDQLLAVLQHVRDEAAQ
jgi:hypothetical protein